MKDIAEVARDLGITAYVVAQRAFDLADGTTAYVTIWAVSERSYDAFYAFAHELPESEMCDLAQGRIRLVMTIHQGVAE